MPFWRYLLIEVGSVKGTNDLAVAERYFEDDDTLIIDTVTGQTIGFEGRRYDVKEQK
jgi:hypothetical protein